MDFKGRTFQMWEYSVSHGSMLIRSPASESKGTVTNLDIICAGVEYVALPQYIQGLEILEPDPRELQDMGTLLGKEIAPANMRIFASNNRRFAVVAARFTFDENENEIFDSRFK